MHVPSKVVPREGSGRGGNRLNREECGKKFPDLIHHVCIKQKIVDFSSFRKQIQINHPDLNVVFRHQCRAELEIQFLTMHVTWTVKHFKYIRSIISFFREVWWFSKNILTLLLILIRFRKENSKEKKLIKFPVSIWFTTITIPDNDDTFCYFKHQDQY